MSSLLKELLGIDPDDPNLSWQEFALCKGQDTELWYDIYESSVEDALAVDQECLSCPVMVQCLNAGIDGEERGVWGGIYLRNGKPDDARNAHKTPEVWDEIRGRIENG